MMLEVGSVGILLLLFKLNTTPSLLRRGKLTVFKNLESRWPMGSAGIL